MTGSRGRPTEVREQPGIRGGTQCGRGSREDPKKTGIQGRPPGDPAKTFYQLQVGQEHTVEREKLENGFPTKRGAVRLRGVNVNKDVPNVRELGEDKLQTLIHIMLQHVRCQPIVCRQEREEVCSTANLGISCEKRVV